MNLIHLTQLLISDIINTSALRLAVFRIRFRHAKFDKKKDQKHSIELQNERSMHAKEMFEYKKEMESKMKKLECSISMKEKLLSKKDSRLNEKEKELRKEHDKLELVKRQLRETSDSITRSQEETIRSMSKIADVLQGRLIEEKTPVIKKINHSDNGNNSRLLFPEVVPLRKIKQ